MISAIGRVIRRSRSAGTGRFDPGRVGNARAAHRATAENLLALLETVIGAVHGAGWALQAEWPLFGLSERPLMRRDEQRRGNHNRWERRSASSLRCKRSQPRIVPRRGGLTGMRQGVGS